MKGAGLLGACVVIVNVRTAGLGLDMPVITVLRQVNIDQCKINQTGLWTSPPIGHTVFLCYARLQGIISLRDGFIYKRCQFLLQESRSS